jgi:hypothetical protein
MRPLVAALLFAAACASPYSSPACDGAADCCDATTSCDATRGSDGIHYCRSMNGGPFTWYTQADATALCSDAAQIGRTRWACAQRSGYCCSVPGGFVDGACP